MSNKIDITGVPITKLPPGEAQGARDLQRWAGRRTVGRSGVFEDNSPVRIFHCKSCKYEEVRTLSKRERAVFKCPRCGSKKVKWRQRSRQPKGAGTLVLPR